MLYGTIFFSDFSLDDMIEKKINGKFTSELSVYGVFETSARSSMCVFYVFLSRWAKAPMHQPVRSFAASSSEKIKERRLDEVCLERFQQYSRTFIQSWITQGKVYVDGKVVNKCGTPVSDKAVVEIKADVPKYVCRAGHKLEAALEQLEIDVTGKVALDSGLSTGGFTDCLLQHGASFVYGVDVGYGQVADKIRRDDRVKVIERTNLRYLSELPQKVDLATLDLSFISILTVMPAVVSVMKDDATLVTLIKPQFEAHRSQVGGGGIVRDPLVHQEVLAKIINGVQDFGFECKGWIESPLKGADGNKEFLASFSRTAIKDPDPAAAKANISKLHRVTQSIEPAI
ncbi:putative rRNA methyltransferase YqxC [Sesamum angolense]|uniref:rRNA methyltransferase YqxC n=1 Tax=Sesamum angolense TaxID=2727404 RepID=A0AAE1VU92_9LAMI|nr:putative rRNA methyltransferase YqxC [Sesamum angolense]